MSIPGHVFISYRSTQSELPFCLFHDLEEIGIAVWIDKNKITGGENWRKEIATAISGCSAFIAVLSPEYTQSDICIKELSRAESLEKPVIPVVLEEVSPSKLPLTMEGVQYIDFCAWDKTNSYREKFVDLVKALDALGISSSGVQPPQLKRVRWWKLIRTLLAITAAVVAFIAVLASILDSRSVRNFFSWDNETSSTTTVPSPNIMATPTPLSPPATLTVPVQDFADNPKGLVVAPSSDGMALWGYGEANGVLFALDTANGSPIDVWSPPNSEGDRRAYPLRPQLGATFRPSALYYDGVWLWIADSSENRVVALDPKTLDLRAEWPLGGEPVAITSLDNSLWVALHDTGELAVATIDHNTGERSLFCRQERLVIGEAPVSLAVEGRSAIWVAYGRGEQGAVRSVSVQGCRLSEPIPLGVMPSQLVVNENTLWAVSDAGALFRLDLAETRIPEEIELDDKRVEAVLDTGEYIWVADSKGPELLILNADDLFERLSIALNSRPLAFAQFGAQTWISIADDTLTQYIVPQYIHPGLVDIAWADDTLWLIDDQSNLCQLEGAHKQCILLELDGVPTLLSTASRRDNTILWLETDANIIWRVVHDMDEVRVEPAYTLDSQATSLFEETGTRLWISNPSTGLLATIDFQSGQQSNILGLNCTPPDVLGYDGTVVWFAYRGARQEMVPVEYNADSETCIEIVTPLSLEVSVSDLLATNDVLFVASAGTVTLVDPAEGTILNVIGASQSIFALAGNSQQVWAADRNQGYIYSIYQG
ncbi:MAG: TIR domain-containing protein [Chloroflexi bacterium]|nr:TIR domain-containing protein [Chloroflexota bacterium]